MTWNDGANVNDFTKAALSYANDNGIGHDGQKKADGKNLVFDKLDLGYYLVDSTVGTLCTLNTTAKDVTIQDKNEHPTVDKKVKEDSTGEYASSNSADIGQEVEFRTTIYARPGAKNYVLHDEMSSGLTFVEVTRIELGTTALTENTDYEVISSVTDKCTFEIKFTQEFLNKIESATNGVIHVYYKAVLNKDAVIGGEGNINKTWLIYGDNIKTAESSTTTYTWAIPIYKYFEENGKKQPLAGAEFTLSNTVNDRVNVIKLIDNGDGTYRVATKEEIDSGTYTTTIVSGADGMITIKGLDADQYYLTEIKAPDGYNKLANPVTIIINGTVNHSENIKPGDIKQDGTIVNQVEIKNSSGIVLPITGGVGTTIIYVIGSILVVGSAVLLILKKRMNVNK